MTSRSLLAWLALSCAACGSAAVTPRPASTPSKVFLKAGSAPGFDKRDFPGLEPMQIWMRESPYVWVGYYLAAPCYAGIGWTGNRAQLEQQGWGLAVIYVGQQAPAAAATPSTVSPSTAQPGAAPDCGRLPLTTDQGSRDAESAVAIATSDGFPRGTVIYLDVERTDPMPDALVSYARGWMQRVLALGFTPGVYAHKLNAAPLSEAQRAVFAAAGNAAQPPFWVANSVGFELGRTPAESGYSFATIWQNPSDAGETWGGVTFRIDRNVATQRSPSAQR